MSEIYDGIDYSQFPPALKELFRNEHMGISPQSDRNQYDIALCNHTNLMYHEKKRKNGAALHMKRCKEQYEVFHIKRVKFIPPKVLR